MTTATSRSSVRTVPLADDLELPLDAATQGFAFLARRGAGKTYAAGVLAEGLIRAGVQTIVLDPVGVWWGLRLSADGKGPGLAVPVLGGLHGDVALEPGHGADVARFLVDHGSSAVLDVSAFRKAGRKQLVTDFAEELFALKKRHRSPLHLLIEEAQMFAPQRSGAGDARMLGAIEDLCRLGRNFGIGFTLISQRPQSVNKEVLSQVECLVVMQTTGPHERRAIEGWIHEKGLDVAEMLSEVPKLPIGQGFLWSPQWLQVMRRVKIRAKTTYDASSTPEVGASGTLERIVPSPDLAETVELLGSWFEEEGEEEPEARRPSSTRGRSSQAPGPVVTAAAEEAKVRAEALEVIEGYEYKVALLTDCARELHDELHAAHVRLAALEAEAQALTERCREGRDAVDHVLVAARSVLEEVDAGAGAKTPRNRPTRSEHLDDALPYRAQGLGGNPRKDARSSGTTLRAGARRMLEALALFPEEGLTRPQLGTLAGLSHSGGTFTTYLSNLRTAGFIEEPGYRVRATPEGLVEAGPHLPPRGRDELLELWMPRLRAGARRMLEHLVERYPHFLSRETLGARTGLEVSGGTFSTYLSNLRSNGLIEEDGGGNVRAAPVFFATEGRS